MGDHTAIPIEFDPTQQRMRGVAVHGRTPFDVPYISHVEGNLWQGGCTDGLVLPDEIQHVVSLYPWERYTNRHELRSLLSVFLYDEVGAVDSDRILSIAEWVNACCDDGPTLVHCQAGLNRSGMVAGAALILRGHSADEAIDLLRSRRSPAVLCNPSFEEWLRGLEVDRLVA